MGRTKYIQGKYRPKNKEKYVGNISNIIYRSSWELDFMMWCDNNPIIKAWSSESVVVPYVGIDGRVHRFFIDFWVKVKDKNGNDSKVLIEIKPKKQVLPPKRPLIRESASYKNALRTFATNQLKWKAAESFAEKHNMKFLVLTEDQLKSIL